MYTLTKEVIKNDAIGEIVRKDLTSELMEEYFLYGEDKTCLPKYFDDGANDIENFEVKNDDIIVASFPRAGTTWTQEMVWLLKNKLDYKSAEMDLGPRFPMLEHAAIINTKNTPMSFQVPHIINSVNFIKKCNDSRFIKTHLPFSLLPKQIKDGSKTPKIIYVLRNPKDVCISYFHMGNSFLGWNTTKENFAKAFLANKVLYAPYWKNVLGYYERKHLSNLLVIKYEDMHHDLKSVVQQVCSFLDEAPLSNVQLEKLCKHLSFKSMQNNRAVNHHHFIEKGNGKELFIRSGKVGEHKDSMSSTMSREFDDWIHKNCVGTNFDVKYAYSV